MSLKISPCDMISRKTSLYNQMGLGEKIIRRSSRNLPKSQLGAVIFGCNHHTFSECLNRKIFGLPDAHYSYVKNIDPGLVLFLFNYSDRSLHGIFKAVSRGQMNFDNQAWASCEGVDYSLYAAQVQMDLQTKCRPLFEDEFKPIIENNYYSEKLFWFELDKSQTRELTQLFLSKPLPEQMPLRPPNQINMYEFENLEKQSNSGGADMKLKNSFVSYASVLNSTHSNKKKWSDFRASSSSHQGTSKPTFRDWPVEVESNLLQETGEPPSGDWTVDVVGEPHVFDSCEKHALEEDGGPQEVYSHGTCVACIASHDFFLLFADGRSSLGVEEEDSKEDLVTEGNVGEEDSKEDEFDEVNDGDGKKLFVIGSKLIVGIGGNAVLAKRHVKSVREVLRNDNDTNNISRFAELTENLINGVYHGKYRFDIIAVGYVRNKPHVYMTRKGLHPANIGTICGIGCGFVDANTWFEYSTLEGSEEYLLNDMKGAFVAVYLQNEPCGGYCRSGIVGLEIDAKLKRQGHVVRIAGSTFEKLQHVWDKVVLIETCNSKYSPEETRRVHGLIRSEFPRYAIFNLFAVIRGKGSNGNDRILWSILYNKKETLLEDNVVYGEGADLAVIRPDKKIFKKYSKIIKNMRRDQVL